jgi:hypothetical protein
MRFVAMTFAGLIGVATIAAMAGPAASGANAGLEMKQAQAAPSCPPGSHWVPEGYVGNGKFREGHCEPNN